MILLLIGLVEGAKEKYQQRLGPYAESNKRLVLELWKFWIFESGQNDIEAFFGSTNQTLQSYTVRTVYVESVDGRKSQATGILPNDNVLGCPEARKRRADRRFDGGLMLNRFSIQRVPGYEETAAACLSLVFLSNIKNYQRFERVKITRDNIH